MKKQILDKRYLSMALATSFLLIILFQKESLALAISERSTPVTDAATKLVLFCADPKVGIDYQALTAIVDYVLATKSDREEPLPTFRNATGAYYELDTRISFPDFLKYSYNNEIPSVLTNPASLRYSLWFDRQGKSKTMPFNWKPIPANGRPIIIHGLERIGITPDINTGIYYKYDLQRTLIHLNHKNRQVFISISKQIDVSEVGKKGLILGDDDDWNYYYSGEAGSIRPGLGWVKSYIYDYFSVGIHVQSGSSPFTVRTGIFQWISAGCSGMNFAQPKHIIKGIKRYAKYSKAILESPKLPQPGQIASLYRGLSALPYSILAEKYDALQQARRELASRIYKISSKNQDSFAHKEQIIQELMLEYFKIALGKQSLLSSRDI